MYWDQANVFCQGFQMGFASIETAEEQVYFLKMMQQNIKLLDYHGPHIGGITVVGKTDWYWVNTGNKVNFPLSFSSGEPNNVFNNESCLALSKQSNTVGFNDITCYGLYQFSVLCQSDDL